ncbi:hypothetical protein COSO111634_06450 [Corallococcus soli]
MTDEGEGGQELAYEDSAPGSAPASEALPTEDEPVGGESDSEQPEGHVTQLALGCPSTTVNWSQARTVAWNSNTGTVGTYQCYGTLPTTSHGFTVSATLTGADRIGTAQYMCSNGSWIRKSGTCDGAVISAFAATGSTMTCSSADALRSKLIGWYLADIKRCADISGLNWWVEQYNNNPACSPANNYNGYSNKDACWRAYFREVANSVENSYNEAQATGHIPLVDEVGTCGALAYPWSSVSAYGTSCKYRP